MTDPYYADATVTVHAGDCLDVLRAMPDASVDAIVTDPPAGIGFMGRGWDHHKGGREQWSAWLAEVMRECYRVAKPGAHAFVWALPRTSHWTACGIEDAGWEIRDRVVHLFATGFPKSHNLPGGLGTALKPAAEDWWLARKPLSGTVAQTVLAHGTGALNIDGCRIGTEDNLGRPASDAGDRGSLMVHDGSHGKASGADSMFRFTPETQTHPAGRWPANVVLDEWSEPVLRLRYNLPTEVERTIRESFNASTDHLPAVPDGHDRSAEQGRPSPVLLPGLLRAVDGGEPDGREGAALAPGSHTGVAAEDERDKEGPRPHRVEGGNLEGRPLHEPRLRDGQAERTVARGAGDVRFDGEGQRPLVHPGASAGRGPEHRAGVAIDGDRASSQRGEGRQPALESGAARVERLASDEARGGRRGDVQAASGECRAAGAPLDVLRRDCPPGWLHYFDVVGERREGAARELDQQSGETSERPRIIQRNGERQMEGWGLGAESQGVVHGGSGGASRFYFTAKAATDERVRVAGVAHPTVKPLALMRWLVRLVTPPGGVVLEPFAGSGTTVEACILEGFRCIAIEREPDYLPLIVQRINRRRDPVAAVRDAGDDGGLFDLLATEEPA